MIMPAAEPRADHVVIRRSGRGLRRKSLRVADHGHLAAQGLAGEHPGPPQHRRQLWRGHGDPVDQLRRRREDRALSSRVDPVLWIGAKPDAVPVAFDRRASRNELATNTIELVSENY